MLEDTHNMLDELNRRLVPHMQGEGVVERRTLVVAAMATIAAAVHDVGQELSEINQTLLERK